MRRAPAVTDPPPSRLLEGLDGADRKAVLDGAVERSLAGGAVLFREGEPAAALFLTLTGRLKLSQLSPSGQDVIVRFVGPGDAFGGLAVLDGRPYPFTATAADPSRVLRWHRSALLELFGRVPPFQSNVLGIVGGHGREMLDRVRELTTETVPQRVARAVLRLEESGAAQPEGVLISGITQQDIADIAGTTLYTVSRTLSDWERAGLVRTGRGRLLVRESARLRALAEG